jgi:hypothetical protein
MFEVVANVSNNREIGRRHNGGEATRQLGAADPARDHNYRT